MNKKQARPDVAKHLPTAEQIDEMRNEREIGRGHLSFALGYETDSGVATALKQGRMSAEKRARALVVFEFHDRHGYLPVIDIG